MSDINDKTGIRYYLFKKRFPAWIYMVIVLFAASIVYFLIQSSAG